MSADPVLLLDHVAVSFAGVVGLADLSLHAPAGAVTVLLGPNGAGKTTAVRVATGALHPQQGRVRIFGLDPLDPAQGQEVRRRCGVVAAKPALYDRLSGIDNLRYAARLYGLQGGRSGAGTDQRLREAAALFGIGSALDLRVGGYSTGMKTRLALARAVLHDPDLLLLDEPTSGLDPESGQAVLRLIDEMAATGKTVVLCTHLLLEAEGLADQVVILDAGRDLITGPPEELVARYWPHPVVMLEAERPEALDRVAAMEGVRSYERNGGPAIVELDRLERVPDVVAALAAGGARLTGVVPRKPTLEELYFAVRRRGPSERAAQGTGP
ncbi:MAG: ABC transporter ATP-binding protein [Actinobacteria bacterium]|nr:ABC transporter ATP-binding protein [Actinomycetota bacterium]